MTTPPGRRPPLAVERRWAAWAGLWAIGGSAALWLPAGLDSLDWLRHPADHTLDDVHASRLVSQVSVGLAVVLPLAFAAVVVGWRRGGRLTRTGLLVGGLALAVAAWAWTGVPDLGPLYPAASLLGGVLALVGAWLGPEPEERTTWVPGALASLALAGSGALVVKGALAGLDYWGWQLSRDALRYDTGIYLFLGTVGAVLVLLSVVGHLLPSSSRVLGGIAAGVLVLLAVPAVLFAYLWLGKGSALMHYWVEDEVGWSLGTPGVAAATGLVAGALAGVRRQWTLVAWSVAAGVTLAVLAVTRESTIQHLL